MKRLPEKQRTRKVVEELPRAAQSSRSEIFSMDGIVLSGSHHLLTLVRCAATDSRGLGLECPGRSW